MSHLSASDPKPGVRSKVVKHYATFGAKSVTGAAIYYMGIVDFLQAWTTRKKLERAAKVYLLGQEADGTSVMHPAEYKVRFQNKMDEIFDLELLESKRRKGIRSKTQNGESVVVADKKRISGRAFAPAGTTLKKDNNLSINSIPSVGFVNGSDDETDEGPIMQQTRPFGLGSAKSTPPSKTVSFSLDVDDENSSNPLHRSVSELDSAKSRGRAVQGRVLEEFSDVQI